MKLREVASFLVFRLFGSQIRLLFLPYLMLATGHALLNLSYALFSGMEQDFLDQIQSTHPHVLIRPESSWFEEPVPLPKTLSTKLDSSREVFLTQAILSLPQFAQGILLRGVEPVQNQDHLTFWPSLCPKISGALPTNWPMSLFEDLKKPCKAEITLLDGQTLSIYPQRLFEDFHLPEKRFTIHIPLKPLQETFLGESWFNLLELHLKDASEADELARLLSGHPLTRHHRIRSWQEQFAETLKLFAIQKDLHSVIFTGMLLFILMSLSSSVYLIYLRKNQEFRTLLWLGMNRGILLRALGLIHLCLSFFSLLLSALIWWAADFYLKSNPIPLPQSLFYSPVLPLKPSVDFFGITGLILTGVVLFTVRRAQKELPLPAEEEEI